MFRKRIIALSAILVSGLVTLLSASACGGGSHRNAPAPASPPVPIQPAMEQQVADVLAELDALTTPDGVDTAVFERLKEALRAELTARFSGKITSTPPSGPENEVTDFAFEDNGDGTYTFAWSYVNVGDYNQDGIVNISDITPLAIHFNESADPTNEWIDGNGDTAINIADITPLASHFFNDLAWYSIEGSETIDGTFEEIGTANFSEGTEGSRKRFLKILNVGLFRYFRVIAYDSTGAAGAGSRTVSFGPSAQASGESGSRTVQFFGAGSTPRGGNVAFAWDFESDGTFDTLTAGVAPTPDTNPGQQSPTYTYPADGTYTATLRVYDDTGSWSTAKVTVAAYDSTPADAAPSASAMVMDLTGAAPFTVRIIGFGDDPDGGSILNYTWDFGDGSPIATGQSNVHTYASAGTYTVKLTVEDDEGDLSDAQLVIKVCPTGNIPDMLPSAMAVPDTDPGGNPVALFGQGADMDGGTVTFSWDYGDNSPADPVQDGQHTYAADGAYYATLHVYDDEQHHSSASATVIAGSPADSPPSAWVVAYILSGTQNMRVQFWADGVDPDGGDVTYEWDFDGDGVYGDFGVTSQDPIAVYTTSGNYHVWLKVTDDEGDSSYASVTITVHPCGTPPTLQPPPPGDDPVIDGGGPDGRIGINAECYPNPLVFFHGPGGGTLYVIYNGPIDAGDPRIGQTTLQLPFNLPMDVPNAGSGHGGADMATPDPTAPAPPSPPLGAGQSWSAYTLTRPLDPPSRIETLTVTFRLRDDGNAAASQTCFAYAIHTGMQIVVPGEGDTVGGLVDVEVRVDPAGTEHQLGFPGIDPGDLLRVYMTIDGVVVGEMVRDADTDTWRGTWDSTGSANGPHTVDAHLYDSRGPQPGDPDDPGPIQEVQVGVTVDNVTGVSDVTIGTTPPSPINAGDTVGISVVTEDADGLPFYDSFFDVFVEISPERSDTLAQLPDDPIGGTPRTDARIIRLNDNGDGTYTHDFTFDMAGTFNLSTIVLDNESGDKVPYLSGFTQVDVIPTEIVSLSLVSADPIEITVFSGHDSFGNVSPPQLPDFQVTSDNPAIQPTGVDVFPPGEPESKMLSTGFSATDYNVGNLTIEHLPSGASQQVYVAYPPWNLNFEVPGDTTDTHGVRKTGIPAGQLFEGFFDIRIPDGYTKGWQNFEVELVWPSSNAGFGYLGVTSLDPNVRIPDPGAPWDDGFGYMHLNVSGFTLDNSEYFGEQTIFSIQLIASNTTLGQTVMGVTNMQMQDSGGAPIFYDPIMFMEFSDFFFTIKPTKTLNMHIYLVEGAATQAQAQADVDAAQDMFNLNALLCTLGFYVNFNVTYTTIPTADWNEIDEDGDGLDRYDANGDGDYADPGDNNDLFNAMTKDYYDVSADTENIYYVPGIRGGYLGATYWPNSQVAVDNSADPDNLTLAHEKVHEMDLRMDGDFDVKDGADINNTRDGVQKDPDADAQGAYGAGNIMNYGDTGPLLTPEQAQHLDP